MCILTPADHNVPCVWRRTLPAGQYGIESWGCVSAMQPTPLSLVVRPRLTYEPHELRSHRVAPMTLRGANACMVEPRRSSVHRELRRRIHAIALLPRQPNVISQKQSSGRCAAARPLRNASLPAIVGDLSGNTVLHSHVNGSTPSTWGVL